MSENKELREKIETMIGDYNKISINSKKSLTTVINKKLEEIQNDSQVVLLKEPLYATFLCNGMCVDGKIIGLNSAGDMLISDCMNDDFDCIVQLSQEDEDDTVKCLEYDAFDINSTIDYLELALALMDSENIGLIQ